MKGDEDQKEIERLKEKEKELRKNQKINKDYAHSFIFVFDLSEPMTMKITKSYFDAFQASEASENKGVTASDSNKYKAVAEFWGNKSDRECAEFARVKGKFPISHILDPSWRRVSAMTNSQVQEQFKSLVRRIHL